MNQRRWRWFLLAGGILLAASCQLVERPDPRAQGEEILPTQEKTQAPSPAASPDAPNEPTAAHRAPGYQGQGFSLDPPPGWRVHEGPSATGKNAWNYFALNLNILVEVKGEAYLPELTVTSRDIPPGSSLRAVFDQTYAEIADQINQVSDTERVIDGQTALVKQYNRPWGEPWYTFQDAWLEVDGKIYVISCQSKLNPQPEERAGCASVMDSLRFNTRPAE